MRYCWRLRKPGVLLSISGSDLTLGLPADVENAIARGIADCASTAHAWVVATGNDDGVSNFAASALKSVHADVPLIGIMPWGMVAERKRLKQGSGSSIPGVERTEEERALDRTRGGTTLYRMHPSYNHFIFVDDGKTGSASFGCENLWRFALEDAICRLTDVPVVNLVVQGTVATLNAVLNMALTAHPIVLLTDSGGAASAIHKYCTGGIDAVEDPEFAGEEKTLVQIKRLNDCYSGNQLKFVVLSQSSGNADLSSTMLEGIVSMMSAKPAWERLPIGARVVHDKRGAGVVTVINEETGGRRVLFDDGESHMYLATSMHKFEFEIPCEEEDEYEDALVREKRHEKALVLTVMWDQPELLHEVFTRCFCLRMCACLWARGSECSRMGLCRCGVDRVSFLARVRACLSVVPIACK